MNYEPVTTYLFLRGAVAQLGERLVRNEKVGGSNPLCSRKNSGEWSVVSFNSRRGGACLHPFIIGSGNLISEPAKMLLSIRLSSFYYEP